MRRQKWLPRECKPCLDVSTEVGAPLAAQTWTQNGCQDDDKMFLRIQINCRNKNTKNGCQENSNLV